MELNIYTYKTGSYFPPTFRVMGGILIIGSLIEAISGHHIAYLFFLPAIVFITSHYRIEIDKDRKTYREYVWLLGYRKGEAKSYEEIEYIFLKKNLHATNMHTRASSATFHHFSYDAYIKFSNGEKFFVCSSKKKEKVMEKLMQISVQLQVKIEDLTGEEMAEVA